MYLLTFVFLVISILGVYTQVLAIEAARVMANQTNTADQVLAWHSAALSLAQNVITPTSVTAAGCNLSTGTVPNDCMQGATHVTITGGPYMVGAQAYPHLSADYAATGNNSYQWKAIAFQNSGSDYVLTYVEPYMAPMIPTGIPPGFISTATGRQLGLTQADLYQQIKNTGLSLMNYGYVSSAGGAKTLVTTANFNIGGTITPVTYAVPAAAPAGSLGIISVFTPCNGC